MLHENNAYLQTLTTAMKKNSDEQYKIAIKADRPYSLGHKGRFNAPPTSKVAVLITGEHSARRGIVLHQQNNQLQKVSETNRVYDTLQYPLLFS